MKIVQEGPNRMVLKDYNISHFVGGLVFAAIGIGVILFVGSPTNIMVYIFGALFALVGIYVILTTKIINITLEKAGRCRFSMRGLIGEELSECNADEIKELRLEKAYYASREHGTKYPIIKTKYQYTIEFVLKNGRELRFEFGKVSTSIVDVMRSPHEKKRAEAKQIADFLGVPLIEIGPPSIGEAFGMMRQTI